MATLNSERIKRRKRRKEAIFLIITAIQLAISPLLVYLMHQILTRIGKGNLDLSNLDYSYKAGLVLLQSTKQGPILFLVIELVYMCLWLYATMAVEPTIGKVDTMQITDEIFIPVPAGNGQYGSERFLREAEKKKIYDSFEFTEDEIPDKKGGVIVHYKKMKNKSIIYYISRNLHCLITGESGSGKTRRILMQTLWLQIITGLSAVVSDVKGEIYNYTHFFAEEHGYKTYPFDLRNPKKSIHINFLQPILDALVEGDKAKAIDYTWDLVSVFVGQPKGEPLWTNGESATIAAGILIVSIDAPREYRNLTNVYYFIANMCKPGEYGEIPLNAYLDQLEDTHPAKGVFAMAEIAPHKTRSSFFTSALGTLRLFTNPNIAEITSKSDINLKDIGREKTILYMIIPDDKKTNYPLVSTLITQLYSLQVELANENGGALPVCTDYDLDEVGNFPYIPVLGSMSSAGRSRGVRVNLVIQDDQQLESKYKEEYRNIRTNCQVKIFLKSSDPSTLKNFSEGLGKYTVEVSSASTSVSDGKKNNSNYSSSASLTGRSLLDPAELSRVDQPYAICKITGKYAGVNNLPDLSEYKLNELYGLGDEEFNRKLMYKREKERPEHEIPELRLWGIWKKYKVTESDSNEQERISFLE